MMKLNSPGAALALFCMVVVVSTGYFYSTEFGRAASVGGAPWFKALPDVLAALEGGVIQLLEQFWEWTAKDAVSLYTGVLALFTLILASVSAFQMRLLIQSNKTGEVAAQAAKQSADALLATERAFVAEEIRAVNFAGAFWAAPYPKSPTMPSSPADLRFTVWIKNFGKTPATIFDLQTDISIEGSASAKSLNERSNVIRVRTLGQNEDVGPVEVERTFAVSHELSTAISDRKTHIFLHVQIKYGDVFGNRWDRRTVWEYADAVRACLPIIQDEKRIADV